ncbi:MAG TPA: DEAD/DEAH box helicase [Deltaproteobacteria bacterium]|nr:DEAD/DEAH box helicase [Deltaproteobacteria bacterium]HPR53151.1 DEAD/DEAH box helicase [Deltaproteobacteria bacterium]
MITLTINRNIEARGLPSSVAAEITRDLTRENPAYVQAERYGRWTGNIEQTLRFYSHEGPALILPRGYIRHLIAIMERHGLEHQMEDQTRYLPPVAFDMQAELRPYQDAAVQDILKRRFGVLQAPPGAGKTVIALAVIAERKQPSLVIVHTKELLYQWRARACAFLCMTEDEVGLIGDGHRRMGDRLTIALVHSLYKLGKEISPQVGFLVVDECHHTPARTFTDAVSLFGCKYMLGLSATPYRRDGLTKTIYLYLGVSVHEIDHRALIEENHIMPAQIVARETSFDYPDPAGDYQGCIQALTQDSDRNEMILADVEAETAKGSGVALILSDRTEHCRWLQRKLQARDIETRLLTGSLGKKERARTVADLNEDKAQALVATVQLIGEGFDLKQLSSVFLTTPIRFDGRVKQSVGRVLRTHEGKVSARVFDYVDRAPVLRSSFKARCRAYQEIGCLLPM